ncbi:magnesium/cobalt transporter CorA [Roseivirga spongicola]|nr:magnesium/cobalt transporter CorA [Roseivirga spongicola]WPZ10346.1 magnesium/cobalt transporter CorA [Roseivirga spongicola]
MPGALIYTGEQHVENVRLELIQFNQTELRDEHITLDHLAELVKPEFTTWVNVVGLHDISVVQKIGECFNIHNLALEDILNINQRPTFDEYDDHFFIAAKMFRTSEETIISEQFSMIVGNGYIITFQEKEGDIFDGVRGRLRNAKGRIRTRKSDYVAFALLDVIVDHYLGIIEEYGDEINEQEARLLGDFRKDILGDLNLSKKEVNYLRRFARPLRDTVIGFNKSDLPIIDKKTRPFLKDLHDHITNVTETIEVYRETINDNLNTYHTHMTNKLNDVLKVLTIFSVVFIPLTFMAGIYGMNFEHMPELSYEYSYPIFWGAIVIVALGMIYYFKRKNWL